MAGDGIPEPALVSSQNVVLEIENSTSATRKRPRINGTADHVLVLEDSRNHSDTLTSTLQANDGSENGKQGSTEPNIVQAPHEERPCTTSNNAGQRLILRTVAYFIYDRFSIAGGHKEVARIGKALVEFLVDERFPPPHRSEMSFGRKCVEFLFAPAASSLMWFLARLLRRQRVATANKQVRPHVFAKALWTVVHRVGRQALIYRLFFRIGSLQYSLASALGIVCCFFKDTLFPDLIRLRRWPKHFSSSQGIAAIFRSLVYAAAFSLPLQRLCSALRESPRRRGNVKKIIFTITLSQSQKLLELLRRISSVNAWSL